MIKSRLTEAYSLGAPLAGLCLALHRTCKMYSNLILRFGYHDHLNQDKTFIINVGKVQSKGSINPILGTRGSPSGRKVLGDRGIVVRGLIQASWVAIGRIPARNVRYYSNIVGGTDIVESSGVKRIRKIAELCSKNTQFRVEDKVYRIMFDRNLYEIAYKKLKSKPGNMTPGFTPTTLDGMSSEVIDGIISKLRDESFQFSPARKVDIPKASGGTRPLSIAPPRDKLVQEVIRMILEAIFEPSFSDKSHGFRPGRSCHTALRYIRTDFQATK